MAKGIKTGGRKAGTPNKKTQKFSETLARLEFDVAEEAVKLFNDKTLSIDVRLKLLEMLATYSHPKPRELANEPEQPSQAEEIQSEESTENLLKLVGPKKNE